MASSALLLLSPSPSPVKSDTLSAAYLSPITEVVSALKSQPSSTELVITVPVPHLQQQLSLPRSVIYDEAQHLLAGLYSLFCAVCARLKVDVESGTPGSLDVRILLLTDNTNDGSFLGGPIVDIASFARGRPTWNNTFLSNDDHTQAWFARLKDAQKQYNVTSSDHFQTVKAGYSAIVDSPHSLDIPRSSAAKPHHIVAVGGTFDHVHAGHKLLLTATALLLQPSSEPRRLIVGITGDELLKNKKYAQYLGSWKERQDDVVQFLLSVLLFEDSHKEQNIETTSFNRPVPNGKAIHTRIVPYNLTIECAEIQDPFGPTITDESVTALVVSGETRSGGQAVNDERAKKGWSSLEVFEIDVLDDGGSGDASRTENFASKISSTAIRKRIAENNGKPSL